jgi:hypothetical protein
MVWQDFYENRNRKDMIIIMALALQCHVAKILRAVKIH